MYSGAGSHSFQAKFTQLGYNKVMTRQAYNKYAKYNIDTVLHASFGYTRDSISSDDNESKRQLNSCYSFFNRLFVLEVSKSFSKFLFPPTAYNLVTPNAEIFLIAEAMFTISVGFSKTQIKYLFCKCFIFVIFSRIDIPELYQVGESYLRDLKRIYGTDV